jgi:hypothetical protein
LAFSISISGFLGPYASPTGILIVFFSPITHPCHSIIKTFYHHSFAYFKFQWCTTFRRIKVSPL